MDNSIALIAIVVAVVAGAGVAWFILRRHLPQGAAEELALAVAYVKDLLVGVVTETEVQAFAGWVYDTLKTGSQYYTRERFIDLVTRAVMRALENEQSVAQLALRDSAFVAHVNTLRQPA